MTDSRNVTPDALRRLRTLAEKEADRAHMDCFEQGGSGNAHDPHYAKCQHPDCVLIREVALSVARAALGEPESNPEEQFTVDTALKIFHKWLKTLPDNRFTHSDVLRFIGIVETWRADPPAVSVGDATQHGTDYDRFKAEHPQLLAEAEADLDADEFRDLDRRSIRTGCETEDNRQADMRLRQLGYVFDPRRQRWVKVGDATRTSAR